MQSNIIELNIAEIDTVVGGSRAQTVAQLSVPNKTMMAMPDRPTYSASLNRPTGSTYNAADLQARLDALR